MRGQTGLKTQDQLAWQAYCYVADELSEAERDAFEAELETNQAAREAVSQAVSIEQAVVAAMSAAPAAQHLRATLAPAAKSPWFQQMAWAGMGAAACLAIVFLTRSLWSPAEVLVAAAPASPDTARELLAIAWVQSAVESGHASLADESDDDEESNSHLDDLAADPDEVAVPSWLLEAVTTGNDACGTSATEGG